MSDMTTVRAYPDRPGAGGAARPGPADDPWTRRRAS
jgi:hypothetical protein